MIRSFVQSFVRPFVQPLTGGAAGPSYESIVAVGALGPNATFSRLSSGTYFDATPIMQTAAANMPRWDHDPLTGAALGLLVEQQSTNLALYSGDASNAAWQTHLCTPTFNAGVAPDGSNNATYIVVNSGQQSLPDRSSSYVGTSVGLQVTFSLFVQPQTLRYVHLDTSNRGAYAASTVFDTTGANSPVTGANYASSVVPFIPRQLTNAWLRVAHAITFSVASVAGIGGNCDNVGATFNSTGDGVTGSLWWGAQIESGTALTSYIPTSGASATRAADILTFPDPGTTGTLVIAHDVPAGGNLFTATGYTLASTATGKTAIAWDASGSMTVVNGGAGTTGAAISWGSAVQVLTNANGHVSNCRLYSTKLTEAQMQALTA